MFQSREIGNLNQVIARKKQQYQLNWLVKIRKNDGWKETKLQGVYAGKSDLEIEMLDQLEDESAFSRALHTRHMSVSKKMMEGEKKRTSAYLLLIFLS